MQRKRAGTVGVWLLAGTALVGAAADFWEQKDFTTWSNQEVEEMLTDSPWSKQVGSNAGGGLAKVTIAWSTALPIRQATVRQAIGLDGPIPPESQQELEMDPPYYVVTLSGLPPTLRWLATTVPAIEAETMLTREDKASIAVKSVRVFQNKQSQLISLEYFDIRVAYDLPQCDYSQEKLDRPCSLGLWDYRHRSVTGGLSRSQFT